MRLPTGNKACYECRMLMIPTWTDYWHMIGTGSERRWIWWCACGHTEKGGYMAPADPNEECGWDDDKDNVERMRRWRAANPQAEGA